MPTVDRLTEPFICTIFGASGDLAQLKIFPALFDLAQRRRLPEQYWIIGFSRSEYSDEAFRELFAESVKAQHAGEWGEHQQATLEDILPRVTYHRGAYDDVQAFTAYAEHRNALTQGNFAQELFYYSIPPQVFGAVTRGVAGLPELSPSRTKLIIEKPFGHNQAGAQALFHLIGQHFPEESLYLLDHYLGKQAVRSILPLRHHNRLLNLMLKGTEMREIQINALEPFGVEERLGYFDSTGTLRDMHQSHLLQILALTTMSIPTTLSPQAIRQEKSAILSALRFDPQPQNILVGQYEGYTQQGSQHTPTFAALRLQIDRESWYGVDIWLRSGKYVGQEKQSYVSFELRRSPFQPADFPANRIVLEMAPAERLHLKLYDQHGDLTGQNAEVASPTASQSIACRGNDCLGEHELLLLDVLTGDQTHFLSFSEIIACWRVLDQVIEYTAATAPTLYRRGGAGPVDHLPQTTWHAL